MSYSRRMVSRVAPGARRAYGLLAVSFLLAPLVTGRDARANGRPPATATIHFRRGMEREIAAGVTFGLLVSRDGGATWRWMCEAAVGYGGAYDPDYAFTAGGALLATTFTGMKVMRDGCTFGPTVSELVSAIAQGPDGKLYYAASDTPSTTNPGDSNIYRSDDGGATWPVSAMPGALNDWWESLEVAPSRPGRLYLSGYRFTPGPSGAVKSFLLLRSDDADVSWQALPTSQIATTPDSVIEIAGISHTDPDLVFARTRLENGSTAQALYRSRDGGMTWTQILARSAAIAFVVRRSGELVAGTQAEGAVRSIDDGVTWTPLTAPPHISCLVENSVGEVWACTQNYGGPTTSDGYGIMKSADLITWTGVLKYQQIEAPVACADGTVQRDTCDIQLWDGLCNQLGCMRSSPGGEAPPEPPPDPGPGATGCCSGAGAPVTALLGLVVGALLLRPARRARR